MTACVMDIETRRCLRHGGQRWPAALRVIEKSEVIGIGHEEILGEDRWAEGMAEDVEILFPVGITIGIVGADAPGREVLACGCVEGIGKSICLCVAWAGVATPSGSLAPL